MPSKKVRVCKVCGTRPADVPDRDRVPPKPTPEACRNCHARRLAGDLSRALVLGSRRRPGG